MIKISQKLVNEVIEYCVSTLPKEACGVLIGERESFPNDYQIDEFIPITNIAAEPNITFKMEPTEWIPLVYAYDKHKKRQIVGILHTHPKTVALPSLTDHLTLWKNIPSHWIISLSSNKHTDIQAYQFNRTSYQKADILIDT